MAHFPAHMSSVEARIINKLISAAFRRDFTISVYDGEEWTVKGSKNRKRIQEETAATDHTSYRIRDKHGKFIGTFLLIHSNEEDVISDYSWSRYKPETEAILEAMSDEARA